MADGVSVRCLISNSKESIMVNSRYLLLFSLSRIYLGV